MNELILVVDDEPGIVRLAKDYLLQAGFKVITAGDGPTALASARSERPDLIVLDLMIPGMDGLDVCRALRHSASPRPPRWRQRPGIGHHPAVNTGSRRDYTGS